MVERLQLTDEHVRLWIEGCAVLASMTRREYRDGHHERFNEINKNLTWRLVGPWSCSLFSASLDGPPTMGPQYADTITWPTAQTWRKALIEATGLTPKDVMSYR
jgi:hypothetical protein